MLQNTGRICRAGAAPEGSDGVDAPDGIDVPEMETLITIRERD
jgi:hypothetical protein